MLENRTVNDRKQHLYLVFDDWKSGYSIRKVSLSRPSDSGEDYEQPALAFDSGEGSGEGTEPLPVFAHLKALRGYPQFFTSAFGNKIMAMHPFCDIMAGVPTVNVQDQTVAFSPFLNAPAFPIYIPVGDDKLYHLDFDTFEILYDEPGGPWMWQGLAPPPFLMGDISYGVQPDGCILFSISQSGETITFIFDTKEDGWELYSDWVFPFTGHGHYDPSLEGFVGLSKDPETLGYLYCCNMPRTRAGDTGKRLHPSPDFKCTKVKVYNKNPTEGQHVSATLVHIGQGEFCLVECVCSDKRPIEVEELMLPPGADRLDFVGGGPQGGRFMYRLKTFSLSCNEEGDLELKNCKVCCYSLPHEARIGSILQDPVAFWL